MLLALQPLADGAATAWILGALEGRAWQEVLQQPTGTIRTPNDVFAVLRENWGEKQDAAALAGAFFKRQQGLGESVADYGLALSTLWARANAATAGTLSDNMLRDAFADGLTPLALRRDIKRFIREKPATTFAAAKTEAQRWMREDSVTEATAQQVSAVLQGSAITSLQAQVAALTTETQSLRHQLQQRPVRQQSAPRVPRPAAAQTKDMGRRQGRCWWCNRTGHWEEECRTKQRYLHRTSATPTNAALQTIGRQQRPVDQQSRPPSSRPGRPLTCWWCNQQGHREADRPAKHPHERQTSQCWQKGQKQRSSRSSGQQETRVTTPGGHKGKFSPALVMVQETTAHHKQGRDAEGRKPRKVICWWCRRQGHIQSECRLKQRTRRRHPNALNPPPKHPVPSKSNPKKPAVPATTHNCQEKGRNRRCPAVVGRQPYAVSQAGVVQPLAGGSERTANRCDLLPATAPLHVPDDGQTAGPAPITDITSDSDSDSDIEYLIEQPPR